MRNIYNQANCRILEFNEIPTLVYFNFTVYIILAGTRGVLRIHQLFRGMEPLTELAQSTA